jgi:hypothetical protein
MAPSFRERVVGKNSREKSAFSGGRVHDPQGISSL